MKCSSHAPVQLSERPWCRDLSSPLVEQRDSTVRFEVVGAGAVSAIRGSLRLFVRSIVAQTTVHHPNIDICAFIELMSRIFIVRLGSPPIHTDPRGGFLHQSYCVHLQRASIFPCSQKTRRG